MTVVVDPAAGALADALSQLGIAASNRVNERKINLKQLQQDPAQFAQLAASYRSAEEAGHGETFIEALKLPDEAAGLFNAFQPTLEEKVARGRATSPTLATDIVGGDVSEAANRRETGEATQRLGLPGIIAQTSMFQQLRDGRAFSSDLLFGVPEAESQARLTGAQAGDAQNIFTANIFRKRTEEGIERLTVDFEQARLQADTETFKLKSTTVDAFNGYLDSLDPNSHEYKTAILGMEDPAQLAHIQFHEGLAVEESLERARLSRQGVDDEKDRLAATIKVSNVIQEAIIDLNAMVKGKVGQDIIDTQRLLINNWRRISKDQQRKGMIFNMGTVGAELESGFFFGEHGILLFNEDAKSGFAFGEEIKHDNVRNMLNSFATGEFTLDQLGQQNEKGESPLSVLSDEERAELIDNLAGLAQTTKDVADGNRTPEDASLPGIASLQSKLEFLQEQRAELEGKTGSKAGVFRAGAAQDLGLAPDPQDQRDMLDRLIAQVESQIAIVGGG